MQVAVFYMNTILYYIIQSNEPSVYGRIIELYYCTVHNTALTGTNGVRFNSTAVL